MGLPATLGTRSKRPAIGPTILRARHDGDLGDPGSPRSRGVFVRARHLGNAPRCPGQRITQRKARVTALSAP
jgi:hypothetical protein